MLERSKGKLRPGLARASDLAVPQAMPDRRQGRDDHGRYVGGNASARGRGWKRAIRELAGPNVTAPEALQLSGDAGSLYRALLSTLPYQGPLVNPIAAESARASVLAAHFAARALELGLDTKPGRDALELSLRLGQRAERTAVTAWDLATRAAEAERRRPTGGFPWLTSDVAPTSPADASHAGDDSEPVDTDQSASASHADGEDNEP